MPPPPQYNQPNMRQSQQTVYRVSARKPTGSVQININNNRPPTVQVQQKKTIPDM